VNDGAPFCRNLAALALLAAVFQLLASVRLGLARTHALEAAATEGSGIYILATLAASLGLVAVWLLRRRPLVAVAVLLLWELLVFWPLYYRTSLLGLALHGEVIAHHFVAILSAVLCVALPLRWAKASELGRARALPVAFAALGVAALVSAHMLSNTGLLSPGWVAPAGSALVLAATVAGLAVMWRHTQAPGARIFFVALFAVLILRIALAGPGGLSGALVPASRVPVLMTLAILTSALGFVLTRPRLGVLLMALVSAGSAVVTAFFYWVYRRDFGRIEDSIGPLTQSLAGFTLPYPSYVDDWKIMVVMFAVFFVLNTTYTCLLSAPDRQRGIALGLLVTAGLGLTSPQLILMVGAAFLLFLDTLRQDPEPPEPERPKLDPVDILAMLTEGLGFPGPIVLDEKAGTVVAVRGVVGDTPVDLRARPDGHGGWRLVLRVGVVGRGRAGIELIPEAGGRGNRPPHEIGRTHRLRGKMRELEALGDGPLDALRPFPSARARFWEAGTVVDLGGDPSDLDADSLAALVRTLAKR
jgi:hypothetical protein